MGMIGRYLDALPDDARDRVIEAQRWRYGGGSYTQGGASCLVGHAAGWVEGPHGTQRCANPVPATLYSWDLLQECDRGVETVWERFDALCNRFGPDRVVRAIKLRAAKPHRVSLEAPAAVVSTEAA